MRLYFLRHGDAEPVAAAPSDAERSLTPDGISMMNKVAAALARLGLEVDVIFTSPLRRAAQTAEIVAQALGMTDRLRQAPVLSGGCTLKGLRQLVHSLAQPAARSILFVGHEPDFSTMVSALIGGGEVDLKKGGLARVKVPGSDPDKLQPGAGTLIWLLTPRVLTQGDG